MRMISRMVACIMLVIVLASCFSILAAGAETSDIPQSVNDYAGKVLSYIGGTSLGKGYAFYNYSSELILNDLSGTEPSGWVFFANDEQGNVAQIFRVTKTIGLGQEYGFVGPQSAKGLNDALSLMEKLQKDEQSGGNIVVFTLDLSNYLIIGVFDGGERVITVNNEKLDDSYYLVRSSSELPARQELDDMFALAAEQAEADRKERGIDDKWVLAGDSPSLVAHPVSGSAPEAQSSLHPALIVLIAVGAVAVLGGGIAVLFAKRKKKSGIIFDDAKCD